MTRVVVDASVAVKWLFPDPEREPNAEKALALLEKLRDGRAAALQPPHWLAEVLAVATRLDVSVAREAAGLLYALDLPVADTPEMYATAVELAGSLPHHLFDTLYHAVALCEGETVFVTADETYFRKARERGAIQLLRGFEV
ncbi:MAG: type II toxin-antitoxin system VapC family toxin [Deferrisomatales bacterium]